MQTLFRGFDHRKTFRFQLEWWRKRSDHPLFVQQRHRARVIKQRHLDQGKVNDDDNDDDDDNDNDALYDDWTSAGAQVFNVQAGSMYATAADDPAQQEWHERRQAAWHHGRKASFKGRPQQRLPLGLVEPEDGGFHIPTTGAAAGGAVQPGTAGVRVQHLLSDGGGYLDGARSPTKSMQKPHDDIDGYAHESRHDCARQATTLNRSTGFPRVGHGIPNSHSIAHFGDYQVYTHTFIRSFVAPARPVGT